MSRLEELKDELRSRAKEKIREGENENNAWNEAKSEMNSKYGHGWRDKYDDSPRSRFLSKGKR
jgi:hypothetical protein